MGMTIDDNVKQKLLASLAEEPTMVLSTAYAYAKNYVMYGEDITKAWATAVQQASVLEQVRQKAWVEAYDSFKKEYENRLKADMAAMLTEIQLEIEESENCGKAFHLGLQMASNIIQQKINELPPVTPQEPRWIPVDDPYTELPKKDLWVTRNDNGNLCVDKIYYDMTEWNDYIGDVVAYMEYKEPVPYKEVMEE